jgi:spermidine/putrescine transport system ATP-binding protein
MALSDRVALLRGGALEQIASPREIYARPATAYAAQFIGQTNLLQVEVRDGRAVCGALRWPSTEAAGPAVFSLRPEDITLLPQNQLPAAGSVNFRGMIQQQLYGGADETLEIAYGQNQTLRVRIRATEPMTGEREFSFLPADAVRVKS